MRDFNYVDDVVEALLLTASDDNVNGKVLNLGGDYVVSLQELANILSELSGCNYKTIPYPDDRKKIDIGDYYADYSQISSLVGWEPRTSLRDGLLNTIQFYSQHINYYL